MKPSLSILLPTFMMSSCDGNNFETESDFRDALAAYLREHGLEVETEFMINSDPASGCAFWRIDLMVKIDDNHIHLIELKFNEEDRKEIDEDLEKLTYCKEHYERVGECYFILLTNVAPSNFDYGLKETAYPPYRYIYSNI